MNWNRGSGSITGKNTDAMSWWTGALPAAPRTLSAISPTALKRSSGITGTAISPIPNGNAHIASSYSNPKVDSDIHADAEAKLARRKFLESEVGIGIDLFAGGGTYDQGKQAARGFAVDGGLQARHPEYFKPDVIPQKFGGDVIYDAGGRYYGVCLASFGICYNADRLKELAGLGAVPPKRWSDLGRPEFFNTVVTADPTKSGSANKCYETILQQAMHEAGSCRNEAAA